MVGGLIGVASANFSITNSNLVLQIKGVGSVAGVVAQVKYFEKFSRNVTNVSVKDSNFRSEAVSASAVVAGTHSFESLVPYFRNITLINITLTG